MQEEVPHVNCEVHVCFADKIANSEGLSTLDSLIYHQAYDGMDRGGAVSSLFLELPCVASSQVSGKLCC